MVETHAGRVVPATRPHALEACVRSMFTYDPLTTLPTVVAPIPDGTTFPMTGTAGRLTAEVISGNRIRITAGRTSISAPH